MSDETQIIHPLAHNEKFLYILKEIYNDYTCHIGDEPYLMTDPVTILDTDNVYQYKNINRWINIEKKNTDPLTNKEIKKISSTKTPSSRIPGYQIYDNKRVFINLKNKIEEIQKMLEEYIFSHDTRKIECYLERDYYETIIRIQEFKKKIKDLKGASIFGDETCMEEYMKVLYYGNNEYQENKDQSLKWAEKLYKEYDNDSGKFRIAWAYDVGECGYELDKKKACNIYENLAQNGNKVCMYNAGNLYNTGGNNIEKNVQKAFEWFEKGYNRNHFGCSVRYANFCYDGIGCEVNKKKAWEIYQSISKKMMGNTETYINTVVNIACYNYGIMLMKERDGRNGIKYIDCAANNGNTDAQKILETIYGIKEFNQQEECKEEDNEEEEETEEEEQEQETEEEEEEEEETEEEEEDDDK